MLRIATSPNRRGKFPGLAPLPGGADAQRLRGFSNKTKNTAAFIPIARTNAAVSVVPPKLPTHGRQSLLCALPVESTAAITSGARLPLLPAMPQHPGVQGEAHGGSFRPGHLCGSHLPALSGRGRSGPYFSRSSLFMQKLYHCFLSVSTSAQQFLQVCAACPSSASFAAQLRHKPYKTLPSHCSVKPCSAIRWARTSSMKWQSR